ncbi:DUF58 domain-containing protein [Neobacillus sp. NRS-1170]|uniref:DUF58 domain-containing protein n=1 Tax=Neobacillus sp. NRS-1170 TaxID=3233898 RepID=UPI003D29A7B6
MIWNKHLVEERKIQGINGAAIILIFVSLYMQSKLVLFLAVFFLAVSIANQFYLKRVGEGLSIDNIPEKKRLFVNGKGEWTITIQNDGFPILKGELKVFFDHFVAPESSQLESNLYIYEISVPFSIYMQNTKQIRIPYTAKMRGIAKIRKLEIHIPSLFGFGESIMESKYFLKQLAIVYPEPIPVKGLIEQMSILQGTNALPQSLYEDRLGPVGTRDYAPTDSFNKIHWKASAKNQTLQTKIYETISEIGWNIALNVSDGHSITGNLEKLLSGITEFAYHAYKRNIPYSICINVRTAGNTPFLYLAKGAGKEHLQKVLETLSSISLQNTSLPYDQLLSFFNNHLTEQPFFIHAGIRKDTTNRLLFNMSKRGIRLFELFIEDDQGVLRGLDNRNERRLSI